MNWYKTIKVSGYFDVGHDYKNPTSKIWWIDNSWKIHVVDDPKQRKSHGMSIGLDWDDCLSSGRYDKIDGKGRISVSINRHNNERASSYIYKKSLQILDKTFNYPEIVYNSYLVGESNNSLNKTSAGYFNVGHDSENPTSKIWWIGSDWQLNIKEVKGFEDHGDFDAFSFSEGIIAKGRYDEQDGKGKVSIVLGADVHLARNPRTIQVIFNRVVKIIDKNFNNPKIAYLDQQAQAMGLA